MGGAFVGRAAELEVLLRASAAAVSDRSPAAAIVAGLPGTGKSRLLRESVSRSAIARQFSMSGHEPQRAVSLAAAMPLLRRLIAEDEHGEDLERALFGTAAAAGPFEAVRVFELVHRSLASTGPALLVVDDVQWVDPLSLALVHHVIHAAEASHDALAVFAAARPGPITAELAEALAATLGDRVAQLELAPLAREDAVALARQLNAELADEEALALADRAGGYPFWIEALTRPGGNPLRPEALLRDRARNCSADASYVMMVLAVCGRPTPMDGIATIAGWPRERVEAAAAELAARGLVVERPAALEFAHDLIREAAAADVPREVVSEIHRRIGEWLAGIAGPDVVLLLDAIGHLQAGGAPVGDLALRLATSPRSRLLGEGGVEQLAALADDVATDETTRLELHAAIGVVATDLGCRAQALASWSTIAERHPSAADRARAALAAAEVAFHMQRDAEAKDWLTRATAFAVDDEHRIRATALESTIVRWVEHHQQEADALAEAALTAARSAVRSSAAHVVALGAAYDGAMMGEDYERMVALADEMQAACRGDDRNALVALQRRGMALRHAGRFREAEATYQRLLDVATTHVLPVSMLEASFGLASARRTLGELESAEQMAAQALALAARVGKLSSLKMSVPAAGHLIGLSRGDWPGALDGLRDDVRAHGESHHRVGLHLEVALAVARLIGSTAREDVCRHFRDAVVDSEVVGCPRCRGELDVRGAEALVRVGMTDEAASVLDTWRANHPAPDAVSVVWHARSAGLLAGATGDVASAVESLRTSLAQAQSLEMLLESLWSRLDLGAAVARLDRGEGAEVHRETAALAAGIGARTEQALAEHALRQLGVRTWRRGAAGCTDDLTDREREIAELVAGGATNLDIASALFLSRKTVERHVSNALAKVGVRNRTELAAALHDEGSPR